MCIIGRELCLTHTVSSNPCKGSAWYILGQSLFYRTVRLRLVKWFAQSHSKNKAGSAFDPSSDWALDPGCVTNTTPQVSAWAMLSESSRDFAKYWYARIQHLKELDSGRLCLEGFTSDPDALSGSLDNGWILFNMPSLVSRLVVELLNKDLIPTILEPIVRSGRWMQGAWNLQCARLVQKSLNFKLDS